MPFRAPHSKQFLAEPPPDGEELASVPPDNLRPLATHPGSSVYGYDEIETWLFLVQMEQQPNFPLDETQFPGIGGHFTTQSSTEDRRNPTTGCAGKPRPTCAYCSRKDFGRIQELERHVRDVHMPPRQCPFCPFMWTRPGRLKDHLLAYHVERFSPEILEKIKPLRGPRFAKFLDEYVHAGSSNVEPTL